MSTPRLIIAGLAATTLLAACWPGKESAPAADLLPPESSFVILKIDELDAPEGTTLARDAQNGFSGQGPCNRYTGQLARDGDSVSFGAAAMTRMACLDEARSTAEQRLGVAFGEITALRAGADAGQVALVDAGGAVRILLAPGE